MTCRHCGNILNLVFCDLKSCPPSNAMLRADQLELQETVYPLKIFVCEKCWLVQVEDVAGFSTHFNDEYTYFSSYSSSWLEHAREYAEMAAERFRLNEQSLVVEIASNDGYLLQYFKQKNIPVLGIEPSGNTAAVAKEKGIPTLVEFFGKETADKALRGKADLIIGNNVLAHVPDINGFAEGVQIALKPGGVATFEFPHLYRLVEQNQFDTLYHEHFSYLSITFTELLFRSTGLEIFDVEELKTHGGSLRIYLRHAGDDSHPVSESVRKLLQREEQAGMKDFLYYSGFQKKTDHIRDAFLRFIEKAKQEKKIVAGYGAAAKGNTLLNYCGIQGNHAIRFVADASPHKQGKFLPGSHIPVVSPDEMKLRKPDYIIIFPWNLSEEIAGQLEYCREWGARFAVFVPEFRLF